MTPVFSPSSPRSPRFRVRAKRVGLKSAPYAQNDGFFLCALCVLCGEMVFLIPDLCPLPSHADFACLIMSGIGNVRPTAMEIWLSVCISIVNSDGDSA